MLPSYSSPQLSLSLPRSPLSLSLSLWRYVHFTLVLSLSLSLALSLSHWRYVHFYLFLYIALPTTFPIPPRLAHAFKRGPRVKLTHTTSMRIFSYCLLNAPHCAPSNRIAARPWTQRSSSQPSPTWACCRSAAALPSPPFSPRPTLLPKRPCHHFFSLTARRAAAPPPFLLSRARGVMGLGPPSAPLVRVSSLRPRGGDEGDDGCSPRWRPPRRRPTPALKSKASSQYGACSRLAHGCRHITGVLLLYDAYINHQGGFCAGPRVQDLRHGHLPACQAARDRGSDRHAPRPLSTHTHARAR